ncbi:MAG: hypothetical protein V1731_01295 [Candidatus Aenigmatarchaeota archaeon]
MITAEYLSHTPQHKCGIGAAVNTDTLFRDLFKIAISTQNRGYDGCGFSIYDLSRRAIVTYSGEGKVVNVFSANAGASVANSVSGFFNNRYRTTGDVTPDNLQPLKSGDIAVSHNGNVWNYRELAREYGVEINGQDSDTKVLAKMIEKSGDVRNGIKLLAEEALGAFNLITMDGEGTVAAYRDPWGFHPLFGGRKGKATYFSSESPGIMALNVYDAEEFKPGELWVVKGSEVQKEIVRPSRTKSRIPIKTRMCPFEDSYFLRPGGIFNGRLVSKFREEVGEELAERDRFPNDGSYLVVAILNSGRHYARGYSRRSGIPMAEGFMGNTDMSRLYMEEDKMERLGLSSQDMAALKNMPVPQIIRGKKLIVVDDSIVRAGTLPRLVENLFEAGAEEANLRIGTPPIRWPCHMGFNHSDSKKLRATQTNGHQDHVDLVVVEERVKASLNPKLTSLHYLPIESYKRLLGNHDDHCFGCFTGDYPFPLSFG